MNLQGQKNAACESRPGYKGVVLHYSLYSELRPHSKHDLTEKIYILLLKFCLTLTNLTMYIKSGLTVDYGVYFKLTVDFYFDRGRSSEYRP